MAAGTIITVLSNIPWGAVVENAPKVAEGAAKLWSTVTRSNKSDSAQSEQTNMSPLKPMSHAEMVSTRLEVVEEGVRQLNEQMQASSLLIKDLAEQNTLLIQRIELNRLRVNRFCVIAALIGTVLLSSIFYLLFLRWHSGP